MTKPAVEWSKGSRAGPPVGSSSVSSLKHAAAPCHFVHDGFPDAGELALVNVSPDLQRPLADQVQREVVMDAAVSPGDLHEDVDVGDAGRDQGGTDVNETGLAGTDFVGAAQTADDRLLVKGHRLFWGDGEHHQ